MVTLTTTVQSSAISVGERRSQLRHIQFAGYQHTAAAAVNNVVSVWLDVQDSQVTVSGSGLNYGIYSTRRENIVGGAIGNVFGTWATLQDATVSVVGSTSNYGLYHADVAVGDDRLHHSQIVASTATITGTGGTAYVAASQLSGGTAGGIALTCAGCVRRKLCLLC